MSVHVEINDIHVNAGVRAGFEYSEYIAVTL